MEDRPLAQFIKEAESLPEMFVDAVQPWYQKYVAREVKRSRRYRILGWHSHKFGWSASLWKLQVVWNRQKEYSELRLEWVAFKASVLHGWNWRLWYGATPEHIER